jgi:LppX_LprAFG lipoprotein
VRIIAISVTLFTATGLASGCSSGGGPAAGPMPLASGGQAQGPTSAAPAPVASDPQAEGLVRASAKATAGLTSTHMLVQLTGQFNRLGEVAKVDSDAQVRPLMASGQLTYADGGTAPFVLGDGTVKVKLGDVWNTVGATSTLIPAQIIDPGQGLPELLGSVGGLRYAGTETIDGVETTKVTGTMPVDEAKNLVAEATGPADMTTWIRKDGDPILVRAEVDFNPSKSVAVTLSNVNAPVHITPAPTD